MLWRLEFTNEAFSDLSKLDKKDASRILRKIEGTLKNPPLLFSKLKGCEEFKLRVGDYRVLAFLSFSAKTLIIEKVGHRKNIYSKL